MGRLATCEIQLLVEYAEHVKPLALLHSCSNVCEPQGSETGKFGTLLCAVKKMLMIGVGTGLESLYAEKLEQIVEEIIKSQLVRTMVLVCLCRNDVDVLFLFHNSCFLMVDGATHKGVAVFRLLRKSFLGCFGIDVAACRIVNLGNLFFVKTIDAFNIVRKFFERKHRVVIEELATMFETLVVIPRRAVTLPIAVAAIAAIAAFFDGLVRIDGLAMLYEVTDEAVTLLDVLNNGELMVGVRFVITARHIDARYGDAIAAQCLDIGHKTRADGISVACAVGILDELVRTDTVKGNTCDHIAVAATVDLSTEATIAEEADVGGA